MSQKRDRNQKGKIRDKRTKPDKDTSTIHDGEDMKEDNIGHTKYQSGNASGMRDARERERQTERRIGAAGRWKRTS